MDRAQDHPNKASDGGLRGEVAIVGMACSFPQARDVAAFWRNVVAGVDAIREVSPDRWDPEVFYDPDATAEDRVYCKRGGYLDNTFAFNPLRYGTMPKAVQGAEPDQFLVLRTVQEALADAGYADQEVDGRRTAFVLGRGNYLGVGLTGLLQRGMMAEQTVQILRALHPEYTAEQLEEIREALRRDVPRFEAETAPGLIPNISTGRSANRFDLMGPTFTIDAACASSLIATDLAVHDLLIGKHDMMLIGGVHVFSDVPFLQVFSAMGALSRTSTIRPFAAGADGTMAGEGVGIIVLKRLADAERDGDRIYAVIKGVGTSSDGKAKSVTAPRVDGEELALRRAYAMAGIDPATVALIEAHGTGTPVGDAAEIEALHRVLTGCAPRSVALGSVKSMIGHTMPAAGSAGLIKTALALYHKILPPTLHCDAPHPALAGEDTPLYVSTATRPWVHGRGGEPRRAAVNAFGFGGVNAHVVLEEYTGARRSRRAVSDRATQVALPEIPKRLTELDSELVVVAARDRAGLLTELERLAGYLAANADARLADVAYTLPGGPEDGARLALVATSVADLAEKIARAKQKLADSSCTRIQDNQGIYYLSESELRGGKVAYLFPGEGSQYINMLAGLCLAFPAVRERFDAADRAVTATDRRPPSHDIFPPPMFTENEREAAEQRLWKIERAVEAVLTADGAMFTLLRELGITPDMITGHSGGEWVASVAAGLFDVDEFIASMPRLDAMYRALAADRQVPQMAMLAVGAGRDDVIRWVGEINRRVHIANDNCPHQVVVVTTPEDADPVAEHLRAQRVFVERLPYDRGYHTPAFTHICAPLRTYFSSLGIRMAATTLYSCTTGAVYPDEVGGILDVLTHTFARPIVFRQTIERMYADGARIFVEVGPRSNLCGFVDDILRGTPHVTIPTNHHRRPDVPTLHHALARLAALHVPMNLEYLYADRGLRKLALDPERDRVVHPDQEPGTLQVSLCYPHLRVPDDFKRPVPPRPSAPPIEPPSAPAPTAKAAVQGNGSHSSTPVTPPAAPNGNGHAPVAPSPASAAMLAHMQVMEKTLTAQTEIMQAYLAGRRSPVPAPAPVRAPLRGTVGETCAPESLDVAHDIELPLEIPAHPSAETSCDDPPGPPPASPAPAAARSIADLLLEIVSDKTGYPPDMLDLDLDMEADFGIDSIKRIEVLGALQQALGEADGEVDLEEVAKVKTLREVAERIGAVYGSPSTPATPEPGAADAPDVSHLAFTGRVVEYRPGEAITLERVVDLDHDLYLNDHHFDPQVSAYDPNRDCLNVIPMTVSVEMMAQVAGLLFPGQQAVQVQNAQAGKWIEVERHGEKPILRIRAERIDGGSVARTSVQHVNADGTKDPTDASPVAVAEVHFAPEFPAPPQMPTYALKKPRTPSHTGAQMYRQHRMFHGPRFQGVAEIDRVGEDGLAATLEVLPTDNLFADNASPTFSFDPYLLDAAGQLVGYWPVEYLDEGFVLFPIRIQEVTRYRDNLRPGERAACHLRVKRIAHRQFEADLDIVDAAGQLWLRITGWQDWRFHWDRSFYDFWRFPSEGLAATELELNLPDGAADTLCLQMTPEGELRAPLWEKLWAYLVCSPEELRRFLEMPIGPRRTEWICGRSVAKDAVRTWIQRQGGPKLYPADIEIHQDAEGRPFATGPWIDEVPAVPSLSIAHKGRTAIAAVGPDAVGVDLEHVEPRAEGFALAAFGPEERDLITPADDLRLTLAWCAKEAAGKAAGVGMNRGPGTAVLQEFDAHRAVVAVPTAGADDARMFTVLFTRRGDDLIALALEEKTAHAHANA